MYFDFLNEWWALKTINGRQFIIAQNKSLDIVISEAIIYIQVMNKRNLSVV